MRFKKILAILFIGMVLTGAVAVANEVRNGKYTGPKYDQKDNVQIKADLPKVPKEVTLLKVEDKNIGQRGSGNVAEKALGVKNLKETGSDNTKSVLNDKDNNDVEVTVYKGGQIKYSTGKELSGMYKKEELLSEKQAKDVAKGFVQRLVDADLLNKDTIGDVSKSEVVNDETCRYNLKDGKTECYASNQHVNVPLSYNGIKIDGGGGKVRTYLGKGGEVVGLMNSVGKLVPNKKVSVISVDDAIKKLKKDGYKDITIEKMEFVYELRSPEDGDGFARPAYKIEGVQHTPHGEDLKFGVFIPATK